MYVHSIIMMDMEIMNVAMYIVTDKCKPLNNELCVIFSDCPLI